jgi:hypothetical protein
LAYLHNHPAQHADAGTKGGPSITFMTTFPTAGTYSLFLDFQHAGAVHTAEFTVKVSSTGTTIVPPTAVPSHAEEAHDHE